MSQQSESNKPFSNDNNIEFTELVIPQGASLKLSTLEEEPEALVGVLTECFKQHKVVRRAFLVSAQEENQEGDEAILMVALEFVPGTENIDEIIHQAGTLACEYLDDNESIDFCLVNEAEKGISHFITEHIQPFYQRKLGSWLRDSIPIKNTK
ncbi:enhanced serine sensitivity protein SseB C-terminal domain-containing protein [Providencia stuartii]|uniref:enhanced serine sensitivity protein SseB C-terminal domain-containing protein n=1 Tax=Providencia stuartii TaxID=588 RepID=UPI00076AEEB7|nr:enhanced serine sensitivity protein SseB C-terminal domain-containing protein [Providencia stuartii]AMG65310.1 enhanced serine sensitivity protein SseB [Providencia stuartii]EMD1717821.1 enhanced serine sensitivity protein SseB C-terminal domain-containing protein [Providencia stuartii]MBG5906341.1 enhanced serine sensitivity protein SseB C-terminal domain-containing protein [Providencia stuartii]WAZ76193.1 enhanced serine sensitivity protein SseB C-terminal domain-containing protein [Provid